MNDNSFRTNLSKSINKGKIDLNTHIQLGASMILGESFDIKKYLSKINEKINCNQISAKKEKYNLPPLFDNLYKRTKNDDKKYQLSTIANDNLPSHRKKQFQIKNHSIDISTTISLNNSNTLRNNNKSCNYIAMINDNNSVNFDTLKPNSINSSNIYSKTESIQGNLALYNNSISDNDEEKFNFVKVIKNIKKFADLSRRDKSVKNIMLSKIAYDPRNSDIIFKPLKIINDYQNYKQQELHKNKDEINTFLTDSKNISKNNVIIKILKKQKKDYHETLNKNQKTLSQNEKKLKLYQSDFSNYIRSQRLANRQIDNLTIELALKNRILLRERNRLNAEIRIKEDERQKYLERIDELRIIAKFVTRVLEGDSNIFKNKIIPEYSSERLPNYELISKEVFEKFDFLLNTSGRKRLKDDDISIIKQIIPLNDSELLIHQYHKIEEDIINILKNKEIIDIEIMEIKKEGKKQIKDIQKRIYNLENELNMYNSIYEREKKLYEDISKRNIKREGEFDDIIKDLYFEVMNLENKKTKNSKKNLININRAVSDLQKIIIEKEQKFNKLLMTLENHEQENKNLFNRAVNHRKNENKDMKINVMKKKIEVGELEKLEHLKNPEEKIIFIQRKTEPPYHVRKKEKNVKIDPEIIKNLENEELLSFK
jgi:hypothetical protein